MEERSYEKGTTVSAEGITVHQLLTEEEFGVPSVILKLVSNRDHPALVTLAVSELDVERIGFHPDFESESWSVEDGTLTFEAELDTETELTTLYAVESAEIPAIERAIDSLEIVAVEPLESAETAIESDPRETLVDPEEETVEDGLADELDPESTLIDPDESGEEDGLEDDTSKATEEGADSWGLDEETAPGDSEPEFETDDDEPVGSTEAQPNEVVEFEELASESSSDDDLTEELDEESDPVDDEPERKTAVQTMDEPEQASDATDAEADEQQDEQELDTYATSTLVEELVKRIESDDLTRSQKRKLRDAGLDEKAQDGVRDAQIAQLQSRMSDIETFTDSIEELFEQYGPPGDVFEEFEESLEAVEQQVEDLETDVEVQLDDLETTVEEATAGLEDVEPRLDTIESDVDEVHESLETVETAIEEDLKEVESDVRELQSWRKKITGALEAFTTD